MVKLEAAFQRAFSRWVQNRWTGGPAAFELKRTLGHSIAVAAVKEHQVSALQQVAGRGLYYKIPDGGFAQSPFDCFFLQGKAYVVIAYGEKLTGFYLIPIKEIELLRARGIVSITEKFAREFGTYHEIPIK